MKYAMTCTCGHEMTVEADSRDAAVEQLKAMMTEEMIAQHSAEKHPGEPLISVAQAHAGIEQSVHEAR